MSFSVRSIRSFVSLYHTFPTYTSPVGNAGTTRPSGIRKRIGCLKRRCGRRRRIKYDGFRNRDRNARIRRSRPSSRPGSRAFGNDARKSTRDGFHVEIPLKNAVRLDSCLRFCYNFHEKGNAAVPASQITHVGKGKPDKAMKERTHAGELSLSPDGKMRFDREKIRGAE